MPQNQFLIATKTDYVENGECDVFIFDSSKRESRPKDGDAPYDMLLKGHTAEGYENILELTNLERNGLAWNQFKKGELLSSSKDRTICRWLVTQAGQTVFQPVSTYTCHQDEVSDVAWHPHHEAYFGSVGEDKMLAMYVGPTIITYMSDGMCANFQPNQ